MAQLTTRQVLWNNVRTLMTTHYGKENLTRLSNEAKVGPATLSRIKEAETSVGIDVLEKIGAVFKVPAWQLLCVNLGEEQAAGVVSLAKVRSGGQVQLQPKDAAASSWPFDRVPPHRFNSLPDDDRRDIETYALATVAAHARRTSSKRASTQD